MTAPTPTGARPPRRWHKRDPDRWNRERRELDQTGWRYRVTHSRGAIGLVVHYPLYPDSPSEEPRLARLRVRFPQTYPWFPPRVYDIDGAFTDARHRNAHNKQLCLVQAEHWSCNTTIAALLATQVPRLIQANRDTTAPPPGLEEPAPEPVAATILAESRAVVVAGITAPAAAQQGALVARFTFRRGDLGAAVLETVYAAGVELRCELPAPALTPFRVGIAGRWIRDPDYHPGETPAATWRRLNPRLHPLEIAQDPARPTLVDPRLIELIGVVIPDEVRHRETSESWLFLLRSPTASGNSLRTVALQTQYLNRDLIAERTPLISAVASAAVVVVGLGAIGGRVAVELAHGGVGRLTLIDRDHTDVATSPRQLAPLATAGEPKTFVIKRAIEANLPFSQVDAAHGAIERLWDPTNPDEEIPQNQLRQRLAHANLIVDATANPAVTRFLDRWCRNNNTPLLHVSATAGAWGGVVALLTPQTGCWACVEHHRLDHALPVPTADPNGWVAPARCADPTFTGHRHQLGQISLHASAIAIHHLAGEPIPSDYFTASMRTPTGEPQPINWSATALLPHPACPQHPHPAPAT